MSVFENPSNGYQEEVTWASPASILLFGPIYLLIRGLWLHFFIFIIAFSALFPFINIGAFIVNIIYAFTIKHILEIRYLQRGWKDVTLAKKR